MSCVGSHLYIFDNQKERSQDYCVRENDASHRILNTIIPEKNTQNICKWHHKGKHLCIAILVSGKVGQCAAGMQIMVWQVNKKHFEFNSETRSH